MTLSNNASIASAISAVAAIAAAVLAGLNLYFSGRREHVRWVRESLAGTFADFLTACYDHRGITKQLFDLSQTSEAAKPGAAKETKILLERAEVAHDQMMKLTSRIRMLPSGELAAMAAR